MIGHPAYSWDGTSLSVASRFAPISLDLIIGIDRQKQEVLTQMGRHAAGHASHDILLWGVRGMGKSALIKSACAEIQCGQNGLALVEVSNAKLETLPNLFSILADKQRNFIIFMDDIGFEKAANARLLRSMLDGGSQSRPHNVRIAMTSNHRNIVDRQGHEEDSHRNRDNRDDNLALADRFGLKLGFQNPNQEQYLAIIKSYADHYNLSWQIDDAVSFAHERGSRTGRTAWHYINEISGRAGKKL